MKPCRVAFGMAAESFNNLKLDEMLELPSRRLLHTSFVCGYWQARDSLDIKFSQQMYNILRIFEVYILTGIHFANIDFAFIANFSIVPILFSQKKKK